MNDNARAFVIARLCDAQDINALRNVWESLNPKYQNDHEIRALKDTLKAQMVTTNGE